MVLVGRRSPEDGEVQSVQQKCVLFRRCFLLLAPCSLRCPNWWRRFCDLFYFVGRLTHGIVSGFCCCKTLQECCLSSCVDASSNLLVFVLVIGANLYAVFVFFNLFD
jgi:hypothetical protein